MKKRENKIIPVKEGSLQAENQMGLRFREREKCLGGEKTQIYRERQKKMKSKITLDLFTENAS